MAILQSDMVLVGRRVGKWLRRRTLTATCRCLRNWRWICATYERATSFKRTSPLHLSHVNGEYFCHDMDASFSFLLAGERGMSANVWSFSMRGVPPFCSVRCPNPHKNFTIVLILLSWFRVWWWRCRCGEGDVWSVDQESDSYQHRSTGETSQACAEN